MWSSERQVPATTATKCTAIHLTPKTAAHLLRASTKQRRLYELCEGALGLTRAGAVPGHHRCCVPARRLMTARTKPGTQSECAASWLDKDGNSCGRGWCFLVRPWRAVPVGRSYRRAPLPTHKSWPIPRLWSLSCLPTSVVTLCQLAPALSLRCLALESIVRWIPGPQIRETPTVSGLSQRTYALTCLPHWGCEPTGADFARSLLQDKQVKEYLRGPASWHPSSLLPNNPRPPFSEKSAIGHQPNGARFALKLVMGSQYLSQALTLRLGTQTSTCTTSNH